MTKAKKEKDDRIVEEIKRHSKVLMEHMEHEVKTVAEQYGSIIKKFDGMDQRFDRVEKALMENSLQVKRVEQKLDTDLTNHEKRIKTVEEKVGI